MNTIGRMGVLRRVPPYPVWAKVIENPHMQSELWVTRFEDDGWMIVIWANRVFSLMRLDHKGIWSYFVLDNDSQLVEHETDPDAAMANFEPWIVERML